MNKRTIPRFLLFFLYSCVACAPCARAQRVLELSSKTGVMILSVSIMNSSGVVVKSGEIKGRGYEWFEVPDGGETFQLKGLGIPTQPTQLNKNDNTFVSVVMKPPTDYDFSKESGIVMSAPTTERRTVAGSTGFVYVGKLAGSSDVSQWISIYLADKNGHRMDLDGAPSLTYKAFKDMALPSNAVLTVDFPLNLRDRTGGMGAVKGIVRAGQKVQIMSLESPHNGIVYANVSIR